MPNPLTQKALNAVNIFIFITFLALSIAWLSIKVSLAYRLNPSLNIFEYIDIIRSQLGLDLSLSLLFGLNIFLPRTKLKTLISILLYILVVFYFLKLTGLYAYTQDPTPYSMIEYGAYLLGVPFASKCLSISAFIIMPVFLFFALLLITALQCNKSKNSKIKFGALILATFSLCLSMAPPLQTALAKNIAYHPYIYTSFASQYSSWSTSKNKVEKDKELSKNIHAPILKESLYTNFNNKNIVIVILESMGAKAISKENTPNLFHLQENSLNYTNAYAGIPHTSKALINIHCDKPAYFSPFLYESNLGTPQACLPQILNKRDYQSVFFQSVTQFFENRSNLVKNLGFKEFYPLEKLNTEGYEAVNYFGYEDDIMLPKSKSWIETAKQEHSRPFLATYLTGTTHHNYQTPSHFLPKNKNTHDKKPKNQKERYKVATQYVDRFVGKLIDQYKKLDIYNDTIFVFVGDHGENFDAKRALMHNNNLYEEGIHVPLIIHSAAIKPHVVKDLTAQNDISTILNTISHIDDKTLPQEERNKPLVSACWYQEYCYAITQNVHGQTFKLIIYAIENKKELYNLSKDPKETKNLANENILPDNRLLIKQLEKQLKQEIQLNQTYYNDFYTSIDKDYTTKKSLTFSKFHAVTQQ